MMRFDRKRRTVRNLTVSALLLLTLYASLGFPPYTVGAMCRRFQHDYLLEDLEPLYVERVYKRPSLAGGETFILARSGDLYAFFGYNRYYTTVREAGRVEPIIGRGRVCGALYDHIYLAGPFEEAVSASAVVRLEKREPEPNGELRFQEFLFEGERLAEQVFVFFDASLTYGSPLQEKLGKWYAPREGRMVACTVTLYGQSGEVLESFQTEVDPWELGY
nr:hypothetical protein [uncultured Oscillibacter sp.]